jgi:hypothetical protein
VLVSPPNITIEDFKDSPVRNWLIFFEKEVCNGHKKDKGKLSSGSKASSYLISS